MTKITLSAPTAFAFPQGGKTVGPGDVIVPTSLMADLSPAMRQALAPKSVEQFIFDLSRVRQGDTVLVTNNCFGIGDFLMMLPTITALIERGLRVTLLCHPGLEGMMANIAGLSAVSVPCSATILEHFTWLAILPNTLPPEDCRHPVDDNLRKMGFDPANFTAEQKRVAPPVTAAESERNASEHGRNYAVVPLATCDSFRSLPPAEAAQMVEGLAKAFPAMTWICPVTSNQLETFKGWPRPGSVRLVSFPDVRSLFALIKGARVVVSPDTGPMHLAGSFDVPCVGLWGIVTPDNRTRYYRRHTAIFKTDACPHSRPGCYAQTIPCPNPDRTCSVVRAITPAEVVKAARQLIEQKP